jgi:uncharacterized protein YgiM (DUF1202 family)
VPQTLGGNEPAEGDAPVPDSAFNTIDALPMPGLNPQLLKPPPIAAMVAAESANVRGEPGTNYDKVGELTDGTQLELLARYGDWFQVQTLEGQAGWVLGQYLTIGPDVIERVETVTSIPDANPALIGRTSERNVNLRGGHGTAYDKIGALGTGTQLDLLGRYEDWFKVRTSQGTVGWVSNELLHVSAFVSRRLLVLRASRTLRRSIWDHNRSGTVILYFSMR